MFARYTLYYHKYDNWSLMLFFCFQCFENLIYEYISLIHKNNTVDVIDCRSYNDYWLIKDKWSRKFLIYLEHEFKKKGSRLKEILLLDLRRKKSNVMSWFESIYLNKGLILSLNIRSVQKWSTFGIQMHTGLGSYCHWEYKRLTNTLSHV